MHRFMMTSLALILFHLNVLDVMAQGTTAFEFEGFLKLEEKPANGVFDFEFKLFDGPDPLFDVQVGPTVAVNDVTVDDGDFRTMVDFGPGVFDGTELFLETRVRPGTGGALTSLFPLTPVNPVPYSVFAVNAAELDGIDSTSFLRKDTGCQICIGHADNNGSNPERQRCFGLSSNGRGNHLQFPSDVDENDRLWLWMECP